LGLFSKRTGMGSIETIEVRTSSQQSQRLENEMAEIVEKALNMEEVSAIKLYHKVRLKSDYMVVLIFKEGYTEIQTGALGALLRETLKDYGIIYHNHWNEIM